MTLRAPVEIKGQKNQQMVSCTKWEGNDRARCTVILVIRVTKRVRRGSSSGNANNSQEI